MYAMCCARSRPISRIAKIHTYIFQEIMMCSRCIKSTQYPFTCSTLSAYVSVRVCVYVFYENRSSQIFYSWWNFKRLPNWDTRFTLSFVCLSLTYYVMSLTSMEDEKNEKKTKKERKKEFHEIFKRFFQGVSIFFSFMKSAFWTGWSIDSTHI